MRVPSGYYSSNVVATGYGRAYAPPRVAAPGYHYVFATESLHETNVASGTCSRAGYCHSNMWCEEVIPDDGVLCEGPLITSVFPARTV